MERDGQIVMPDAYELFEKKFERKKTTDDCYTPQNVYDAVADWVAAEYGLDRAAFVRPFWPDANYRAFDYPDDCVVVDNPPFSIRAEIVRFYMKRGIRFFLFAPALTMLLDLPGVCSIAVGVSVRYANGAEVPTSFQTNLDRAIMRTAPALYRAIEAADTVNRAAVSAQLPKYVYPPHVVTAAIAQRWCRYGVEWRLAPESGFFTRALDSQRAVGAAIFGSGYLLSHRAAVERAAAERAAAERATAVEWTLSAREQKIVDLLDRKEAEAGADAGEATGEYREASDCR